MTRIILLSSLLLSIGLLSAADQPYDFRSSEAYRQLSTADQQKLEQVRQDQLLLWGALDLYADEHNGELPNTLDDLVPRYLRELPADPFVTEQQPASQKIPGYTPSKGEQGYLYRRGSPGNRAWILLSVGLPEFPYRAEKGSAGLFLCKGMWISGVNPVTKRSSGTGTLDEAQILAIARKAVATNDTWLDQAEFETPKRRPDGSWSVWVWRLPKVPGGHRVILIDEKGGVTAYQRGR